MPANPPSAPRPLQEEELAVVTGGYGWLSNPLQDARDHSGYTPPVSIADQMQDFIQQQIDAQIRAAMGED